MSGMVAASSIEDAGATIQNELCALWVADAKLIAVILVFVFIRLCGRQIMFRKYLEIVTVVAEMVNTAIAILDVEFGPGWNPTGELAALGQNTSYWVLSALAFCLEPIIVLPCLAGICWSVGYILCAVIPLDSSSCIVFCFP